MLIQLASRSPRRRELLDQIGVRYTVVDVDVPENLQVGESPESYVCRLALAKARAGFIKSPGLPTLGADTIVCCDKHILEKPLNLDDCERMLGKLSGRAHSVMTAVAMCDAENESLCCSVTEVHFRSISLPMIRRYWQTGEPQDKAGAYAIQGLGAVFVTKIIGSYSGVVGLPIEIVTEMLLQFDVPFWVERNE